MDKGLKELIVLEGMVEAEIIRSKLNGFEIPCMLKYESVGRVFGITTNGLGKVRIMVPEAYLSLAREIIGIDS